MTQQIQINQNPSVSKYDELILVVRREHLLQGDAWTGIKQVCFDELSERIRKYQEFQPRGLMEQDPTFKQIIPYLIFEHNDHYFLMQRSTQASETRLQNKYTLGIGGHVRQEDLSSNSIIDWAQREFYEEVDYSGTVTIEPIGLLNDDSNAVGQVHAGVVFIVHGSTNQISVKSELQSGSLVPLEECMQYNKHLEAWSQFVLMHLLDKKYGTEPQKCCC